MHMFRKGTKIGAGGRKYVLHYYFVLFEYFTVILSPYIIYVVYL